MGTTNPAATAEQEPELTLKLFSLGVIQLTLVNQRSCLINETSYDRGGVETLWLHAGGATVAGSLPYPSCLPLSTGVCVVRLHSIVPERLLPRGGFGALRV